MSKVKEMYESLSETKDPNIEVKIVETKSSFKIVSEDGTAVNTKIFYGDVKLEGITNLNLSLDAEVGVATAHFTVIMPLLNIALPSECIRFTPHPDSKLIAEKLVERLKNSIYENSTVPKKDIDQDSVT